MPGNYPYGANNGGGGGGGYGQSDFVQAREKMLKRRSIREIELTDGNLVLELPVPRSILQYNSYRGEDLSLESGKLRYTAVTGSPVRDSSHFDVRWCVLTNLPPGC